MTISGNRYPDCFNKWAIRTARVNNVLCPVLCIYVYIPRKHGECQPFRHFQIQLRGEGGGGGKGNPPATFVFYIFPNFRANELARRLVTRDTAKE